MKNTFESNLKEFLPEYLDKNEISPFMKQIKSCVTEDEQIELIDRLIKTGKTKIELIEKGELTALPHKNLFCFKATGIGTATSFVNGEWKEFEKQHDMIWVEHHLGDFKFVIEPIDDCAILTLAEVNPLKRRKGLFKQMLNAIRDFAFEYNDYTFLMGRADIPNTSLFNLKGSTKAVFTENQEKDWRSKIRNIDVKDSVLNSQPTRLFDLWCKQKFVYPRGVVEWACGDDEFIIVNSRTMQELNKRQVREFENSYPKKKSERFRK